MKNKKSKTDKMARKEQKAAAKKAKKQYKKERNTFLRAMKKYEPAQISGIIPIGAWDAEGNYGILRDGTIIDFLQIRCKNLYNASDAELAYDNIKWDKLFMTYPSDLKYIALNFPLDVSLQISYTKKVAQRTANPVLFPMLEAEYDRLQTLAEKITDRDYYLVFYADDYIQYLDKKSKIKGILNQGITPLVFEMPQAKKELIIYKLNNLNSTIFLKGGMQLAKKEE